MVAMLALSLVEHWRVAYEEAQTRSGIVQSGVARRRSICGRPQGGRVRVDRLGIGSRPGMRINCLTDIRCWNKHRAASRSRFALTGLSGSERSRAAAERLISDFLADVRGLRGER